MRTATPHHPTRAQPAAGPASPPNLEPTPHWFLTAYLLFPFFPTFQSDPVARCIKEKKCASQKFKPVSAMPCGLSLSAPQASSRCRC